MTKSSVRVQRVYDERSPDDGFRVLVDRIWPRGVRKNTADLDDWIPDAAPSTDLRKWFGHDPDKFGRFRDRYRDELGSPDRLVVLDRLARLAREGTLTLVTATKDVEHSHAAVLAEVLRESGH